MPYLASPSDYLMRLRAQLNLGKEESLLYGALELRLGVEARMKQYLDPLEHIPAAHKKEWRIPRLGKNIRAAFKSGDAIVHFNIHLINTDESFKLKYVPVSKRLEVIASTLGDYLHFPGEEKVEDPERWEILRKLLREGEQWFAFACSGELIGMPLLHMPSKQISLRAFFKNEDPRILMARKFSKGAEHVVEVDYEAMPKMPPRSA